MKLTKVGIVGCGNISGIYLSNLAKFDATEIHRLADLDLDRARHVADQHGVPFSGSVEDLLNDADVDVVLNLTVPKAHANVNQAALNAGKHVYVEKPFAVTREDALATLELARSKNLRTGAAPDTFLGAGIQTCRALIDDGAIGRPIGAQAFMLCRGHETWHPSPEFYYETGGGPMLDMGPYYLTALVNLLGPVKRVCGSAQISFAERTITSQPKAGKVVRVETPTHLSGVLDFESGAVGAITTSFDVTAHTYPNITVFGSEGSIMVPDPNGFGGPVQIRCGGDPEWRTVEIQRPFAENSRGLGLLDMVMAIRNNRPTRASGELAAHVLDIMLSIEDSSREGRYCELTSGVPRPTIMPADSDEDNLAE